MEGHNRSGGSSADVTDGTFIAQVVSPNVRYLATLLGIIAMQSGVREKTYKRGEEVERQHEAGEFSSSRPFIRVSDIVGAIGHDMIHSGDLAEMRDFRNHLFHGLISVNSASDALTIRDGVTKNCVDGCKFFSGIVEAVYTVEELEAWTIRFLLLDPFLRDQYVSTFVCLICGSGGGCECNRAPGNQQRE